MFSLRAVDIFPQQVYKQTCLYSGKRVKACHFIEMRCGDCQVLEKRRPIGFPDPARSQSCEVIDPKGNPQVKLLKYTSVLPNTHASH